MAQLLLKPGLDDAEARRLHRILQEPNNIELVFADCAACSVHGVRHPDKLLFILAILQSVLCWRNKWKSLQAVFVPLDQKWRPPMQCRS